MTDEKKGWQIDFSPINPEKGFQIDFSPMNLEEGFQIDFNKKDYNSFLTMGATFTFLGSSFSSLGGFPTLFVLALLIVGMILTVYAFVMKVAEKTAPEEN